MHVINNIVARSLKKPVHDEVSVLCGVDHFRQRFHACKAQAVNIDVLMVVLNLQLGSNLWLLQMHAFGPYPTWSTCKLAISRHAKNWLYQKITCTRT
jgi:hypothetical protein